MSRVRSFNYKTKKQKDAERLAGKMISGAFKLGAVAVNEISKSSTNKKTVSTPIQEENSKSSPLVLIFPAIFIVIAIFWWGEGFFKVVILNFIISTIITLIIAIIVGERKNKNISNSSTTEVKNNLHSEPIKSFVDNYSDDEKQKIKDITALILADNPFEDVKNVFKDSELNTKILIESFNNAVDYFLDDGFFSKEEENRIVAFKDYFNLSQTELDNKGNYEKIVQFSILREIAEGNIPDKFNTKGDAVPFILGKNEQIIWVFQDVNYYEETTERSYIGENSGVSMKIANGLYYRTGYFKGKPLDTTSLKSFGLGLLAFTNKHIFFCSLDKSFKIPYSKMISVTPYEDGVRIQKEGVRAKPQFFSNVSGWFSYNLIMNLSKM